MIDGNYSYISSVFPNYKSSEINSLSEIKSLAPNKLPIPSKVDVDEIYKKFVKEKQSDSYFYNTPLGLEQITSPLLGKPITQINSKKMVEKFSDKLSDEQYVYYVLNSDNCKKMIINALNLESSKRENYMMIEFLAFVLIGIFLIYITQN